MKNIFAMAILLLILFPNITIASSDIKEVKLDDTSAGSVYFHYNPDLTKLLLKDVTDKDSGILTLKVAELKLSSSSKETIVLEYSEGGSSDPGFMFYKKNNNQLKRLGYLIDGLHILVPGNNLIYIWGHTNSDFNIHKSYKIENDKIEELTQPYYYVGIENKTLTNIIIYESIDFKKSIDNIKKGDIVTVLLIPLCFQDGTNPRPVSPMFIC
jgi:hypothetical protein